ncbi:hypothetical protein XELAEV_18011536mg [Xenopus laevis]|uniref:Uncharacterized protein n=1 Tax=Xenopus laevis TaxID=8355 RepID=A0A974DM22_XENLA|nr:hypothetical protein XELAEV_18011536mg [Xenopus laevis]
MFNDSVTIQTCTMLSGYVPTKIRECPWAPVPPHSKSLECRIVLVLIIAKNGERTLQGEAGADPYLFILGGTWSRQISATVCSYNK